MVTMETYIQTLEEMVSAAVKAITDIGHSRDCKFAGCTCGAAEAFAVSHLEFWRKQNELRRIKEQWTTQNT